MKKAFLPIFTLLLSAVSVSVAIAAPAPGRKLPGPSAVEAARLKKSPPPNYLSHYLPDDRYKIAGGIWKYVSTDLDTYYHVPSSPNMLRQPANRVIGFASARDAEEAGLVADPTDGTANKASSQTIPTGGLSGDEARYVADIRKILRLADDGDREIYATLSRLLQQARAQNAQDGGMGLLISARPIAKRSVVNAQKVLAQFNRLKPPARMQEAHRLLRIAFNEDIQFNKFVSNAIDTANISAAAELDQRVIRKRAAMKAALTKLVQVGK